MSYAASAVTLVSVPSTALTKSRQLRHHRRSPPVRACPTISPGSVDGELELLLPTFAVSPVCCPHALSPPSRTARHEQQQNDKQSHHEDRDRPAAAAISRSRSSRRRIFSALLLGSSSRNSIDRGIL